MYELDHVESICSNSRAMRRSRWRAPRVVTAAAVAITVVAVGGAALAEIPSSDDGTFTACITSGTGAVRIIDGQAGEQCRKNERTVTFNQKGQKGDVGPEGPDGADGQDGAMGPQGPAGRDGATGPQGDQGLQGAQGIQGPPGPAGTVGESEPWHEVDVSPQGWVPFFGGEVAFYKDAVGEVHLRGNIVATRQDMTFDPLVFVLPPGYRPERLVRVLVYSESSTTRYQGLDIKPSGEVRLYGGGDYPDNRPRISLNAPSFRAFA